MARALCILALLAAVAAGPGLAADPPAENSKNCNSIERTVNKTGKAPGRTADKVEKSVK